MAILFEKSQIKGLELKNRLVRSATYDGMALKNGHVSNDQIVLYENLAKGGVGLIVTGITSVHSSGRISAFQNVIDSDDAIQGFKQLVERVHGNGAKIAIQLFHGGRECAVYQRAKHRRLAVAPSVITDDPFFDSECREITHGEILELIEAFGTAAARARVAGFDAVQIHGAHAYLFSQFLSPSTNRRQDDWGGSLDKRLAFLRNVYRAVRSEVGEDYPVMIKLGVADGFPGGLAFSEGKLAATQCAAWGFDAIEISQGLRGGRYSQTEFRTGITKVSREAYFRNWCLEVKRSVTIPVMMVGGLRSYSLMTEILQNGEADHISFSRPLIREPDIPNRWKQNDFSKPACISCNRCFDSLLKGIPLKCILASVSP